MSDTRKLHEEIFTYTKNKIDKYIKILSAESKIAPDDSSENAYLAKVKHHHAQILCEQVNEVLKMREEAKSSELSDQFAKLKTKQRTEESKVESLPYTYDEHDRRIRDIDDKIESHQYLSKSDIGVTDWLQLLKLNRVTQEKDKVNYKSTLLLFGVAVASVATLAAAITTVEFPPESRPLCF